MEEREKTENTASAQLSPLDIAALLALLGQALLREKRSGDS